MLRGALIIFITLVVAAAAFVGWAGSGTLARLEWVDGEEGTSVELPDTLTIMTYNVGYLSGMSNNRAVERDSAAFAANMDRVASAVRTLAPDVLALQEIDVRARRSFYVNQVDELSAGGGFHAAAVAVNWDERYVPFPSANPKHHFGRMVSAQALLSRFPLTGHERIVLPSPAGAPLYDAEWLARLAKRFYIDRLAQVAITQTDPPIAVVNVHMEAWDAATRESQAERLVTLFDSLRSSYPVFIAGDFNTVMPAAKHSGRLGSRELARFADDRSMERLLEAIGLQSAFPDSLFRRADPATFTFSSAEPHVAIDHILYDPRFFEALDARVVDVEGRPSDHRPVVARFVRRRTVAHPHSP